MSSLHWEAVRRQHVVDKRHEDQQKKEAQMKELAKKNQQEIESELKKGSKAASYHRELLGTRGQTSPSCNHPSLDEQRRLEHQELIKEHFYKSRLRYNDINFAQQW